MAKGNQILTQLLFSIEANSAQLKQELNSASNTIKSFGNTINKIGGMVGIAFSAGQVLQFGLEVSKLAGEAKGVENAFKKLANSTQLLDDMKRATSGTVSELELMKRAVAFENFGLDLAQLPKLLEFATKRAAQTGQSVDYLVDSIVTGLGRKSVLILDNLGISSTQLNAEIAKTGDFFKSVGTIVDSELEKMGDMLETTVTKTSRLAASWENFKVSIGKGINEGGFVGGMADAASNLLDVLGSENLNAWQKAAALAGGSTGIMTAKMVDAALATAKTNEQLKRNKEIVEKVDIDYDRFAGNIEAYSKSLENYYLKNELVAEFQRRLNEEEKKKAASIENITNLQTKLNELEQTKLLLTGQALINTNREIKSIQSKIKALQELGVEEEKQRAFSAIPDSIKAYQKDILANQKISNASTDPTKNATAAFSMDSAVIGKKNVDALVMSLQAHNGQLIQAKDTYTNLGLTVGESLSTMVNGVELVSGAITSMLDNGRKGFSQYIGEVLRGIRNLLVAKFAEAMVGLITHETTTKGVLGLGIAAAGAVALTAMWEKLVPAFAKGGYSTGGLALVGEQGAELVNLPAGSKINNHSASMRMLGGNGNTVNVVGYIDGDVIRIANARANERRFNSI